MKIWNQIIQDKERDIGLAAAALYAAEHDPHSDLGCAGYLLRAASMIALLGHKG